MKRTAEIVLNRETKEVTLLLRGCRDIADELISKYGFKYNHNIGWEITVYGKNESIIELVKLAGQLMQDYGFTGCQRITDLLSKIK